MFTWLEVGAIYHLEAQKTRMAKATEKSAMPSLSCSSAATFGYTDVMFVTLARA